MIEDINIKERMCKLKELQLLVVIVERHNENEIVEIFKKTKMPGQYVISAEGTTDAPLIDALGFSYPERSIIFGFKPKSKIPELLSKMSYHFTVPKKEKGFAFSIPISGMLSHIGIDEQVIADLQCDFESEVEEVNKTIEHDLIITIVDEGNVEDVMKAARKAGATGGTAFHALHFGREDIAKFFGIPLQEKKDVVGILVERSQKIEIMKSIKAKVGNEQSRMMFTIPADNVVGLD
ncbi:hypothetical protein OKW22_001304 [Bacilli bacterium PM5-3]|nr:hypothetical protein [Bacilli bacterium PM5-3]MDH6603124.1 hypothetical protein [Bacilli bacterium PM5-9]